MIQVTDEIRYLVNFFQSGFTILIALALGEALRQFVAADIRKPEDAAIHWGRLPALMTFIFLILPFFQGMNRYFYLTYLKPNMLPDTYALWLIIDGAAFISEATLFFVMSRLFSENQWRRFFHATLTL